MSDQLEVVAMVVTTQELKSGYESDIYEEVDCEYENPTEDRPEILERIGETHSDYVSDDLESDDVSDELDSDDDSNELDSDDDSNELDSDDDSDELDSDNSDAAEDDDQGPEQELTIPVMANMLRGIELLSSRNI